MSPRTAWRSVFLGLTALVIGMELVASFDGSEDTRPWTDEIVDFIPAEVAAVGIGGLSLWLIVHFGVRYYRKHRTVDEPSSQ